MGKEYSYKAFGLRINSEFEIPELQNSDGVADVNIKLYKTPENLQNIIKRGVKFQAAQNEFLLEVDNIAKFFVKNGDEIIIETDKKEIDKEVRLFLLGSAFGALFIQRGLLPIHGSAVKFGERATVFSGLSGVGKSSIAAYFVNQGRQALADDISVINGNLEVSPGFPSMKIWGDMLKNLKIESTSLAKIRSSLNKFHLPYEQNFHNEPLALKNVIILNIKNSLGFEHEELTGIKKFNAIKNNTYRYRFIEGLKEQERHFQIVNKLLKEIKVYRVSRPRSPVMIQELSEYLLGNFFLNE